MHAIEYFFENRMKIPFSASKNKYLVNSPFKCITLYKTETRARFLETRGGARLLFKYIKVHLFVQVCVCVEIYARCCAPGFHTHITAPDPDPALWSEPDPVIGNAIGSDPDF